MRLKIYIAAILLTLSALTVSAKYSVDASMESGSVWRMRHFYDTIPYLYIEPRVDPKSPIRATEGRNSRWYYFALTGVKDQIIAADIRNTDAQRPMYSYDNKTFHRFSEEEMPERNGTFTKRYLHDTVYIAYFTPYTLTRNIEQIERWCSDSNVLGFEIGTTDLGTPLQAMVITERPHSGLIPDSEGSLRPTAEDLKKSVVYIHSRIHPSETPASWHCEALVDQLLSERPETLRNTIYYIIPMINPDGVAGGFSRTNPRGVNLESNYNAKIEDTEPEVAAVKRLLGSLDEAGMTPAIALNMHSQSTPELTYWVHTAKSTSPYHNRRSMLFAALSIDGNPLFRWENISRSRLRDYFLEGWIYKRFRGESIALTFETPYSYYNRNANSEWVTIENLQLQARYTLNAISDILGTSHRDRVTVSEPDKALGYKRIRSNRHIYFGESHLQSRRRGESITYRCELEAGEYDIYRWIVGENTHTLRHADTQWRHIDTHIQKSDGEFSYTIASRFKGERHDQLLLKRRE